MPKYDIQSVMEVRNSRREKKKDINTKELKCVGISIKICFKPSNTDEMKNGELLRN
jgi:hypothetical protein